MNIYENSAVQLHFDFENRFQYNNLKEVELEFSQEIYFSIVYSPQTEFNKVLDDLIFYKEFFNLFSDVQIFFKKIYIFSLYNSEDKCSIYIGNKTQDLNARLTLGNCFNDFNIIKESPRAILERWHSLKTYILKGFDFYLQVRNQIPQISNSHAFLNIVFSLETLHTNFFDKNSFTDEDYKNYKTQKKEAFEII